MEWWWIAAAAGVVLLLAVIAVLRRSWKRRRPTDELPITSARRGESLRRGLLATRRRLAAQFDAALGRSSGDVDTALAALEEVLIAADVGVRTAAELRERVGRKLRSDTGRDNLRRV